jgi:hypothetical protein
MIRTIRLVRKPAGQSDEEFRWAWLLRHGSIVREAVAQSDIHKVTASFADTEQISEYAEGQQLPVPLDFDAVESVYFPTVVHLQAGLASGVLDALDASLDAVTDSGGSVPRVVALEETMARRSDTDEVLGSGPRKKLLRTLKRKEDIDLFQFRDYWHNHHKIIEMDRAYMAPMPLTNVSFSRGHTIADGEIRSIAESDGVMDFDGILELFFAPDYDPIPFYKQPFSPEIRRDELNFLSMELPIRRAVMHEYTIAERTAQ